ncbi:MAG: hypothetical protein DBX48_00615 [Limosilactobacillus fermentum]|nr:MAG: hypothetical protein DBX48_00615 [Limosilactobacillus fermentum]
MQDLVSGLKEMEFQVAYSHFAEGEVPKCPYIVVQGMGSDNFSADGIVYHEVEDTNIELYCDKKDLEVEKKISDFLTENKIYYEKTETYIESEKLIQVVFEI